MEVDQNSEKLLSLFVSINLAAASISFGAVIIFGIITGLLVFAALTILLPLFVQYIYLDKKTS